MELNLKELIDGFGKIGLKVKYKIINKGEDTADFKLFLEKSYFIFQFIANYFPHISILSVDEKHNDILFRIGKRKYLCGFYKKLFIFDASKIKDNIEDIRLYAQGKTILKYKKYKIVATNGSFKPKNLIKDYSSPLIQAQQACLTKKEFYIRGKVLLKDRLPLILCNWHTVTPNPMKEEVIK